MRKTIPLYLAREVLSPFFLGLFVLTFVLLMFQLLKLTELVVNYGLALKDVGRLILYIVPPFFTFTVPMSFLLGVLLAFARLSSDSELIALRASGVSLYQLYPIVGLLSLVVAVLAFLLTIYAEPWGRGHLKRYLFELSRSKATLGFFKDHVFNTDFEDLVIYVNQVDPKRERIVGVFVYDTTDPGDPKVTLAKEGYLVPNPYSLNLILRLADGAVHKKGTTTADAYDVAAFVHYDYNLSLSSHNLKDVQRTYLEMPLGELKAHVAELRALGGDYAYEYRRAWTEYHKKFAFPFAAIIFGFLGIPLSINPVRSGRSRGFALALGIIVFYYLLFRAGETIGWKGVVHPAVVMWAPNAVLGAIGLTLFFRKARETEVAVGSRFDRATARLRALLEGNGK